VRDYAGVWRTHLSLFSAMVRADSLSYRGYQLLAFEEKRRGDLAGADRLYARAFALYPSDPTLLTAYGEYFLDTKRPASALSIGMRLLGRDDMRADPRAVTLFLNATDQVWGGDSTLAVARRLMRQKSSGRAALFAGMVLEARGDTAAARAVYRDGLRLAPSDSFLLTRAAALDARAARPR
jgi:Tfp pilus assembly protein PilF